MTDKATETQEPKADDEPKTPEALADENARLREQLANMEIAVAELKENEDRLRRSMAFYENRKRQVERELEELRSYGVERMAKKIIETRDNLWRALEASTEESATLDTIREGVEMAVKQLDAAFESEGITPIEAVGRAFDPNAHEAVAQIPTDTVPPNHVADEYQRGYRLKERLLRPAMVIVAAPLVDDDDDNGRDEPTESE